MLVAFLYMSFFSFLALVVIFFLNSFYLKCFYDKFVHSCIGIFNVIIVLKLFLSFNRGFDYKIVKNVSSASEQDFSVETST